MENAIYVILFHFVYNNTSSPPPALPHPLSYFARLALTAPPPGLISLSRRRGY